MVDPVLLFTFLVPGVACAAGIVHFMANRGSIAFYQDAFVFVLLAAVALILVSSAVGLWGTLADEPGLIPAALAASGVGYGIVIGAGPVLITRVGRKEAEYREHRDKADAQRAHLDAIFHASEGAGVAVVLLGAGGAGPDSVIRCSGGGARLLGSRPEDVVGRAFSSFVVPEDQESFARLLGTPRGPDEAGMAGSLHLTAAGGDRVPVDVGLTRAGPGTETTAVFLVDARARYSAEAAAEEARSDAEFYLDLVTHDLSNFNQGALGYLELFELSTDAPPERLDRFHHSALEQIQNCSRLIENVKLLSIIRDSREPLGPVDGVRALHDAMQRVVVAWTKKHVEMRLVPTTPQTRVVADAWLEYLFYHILDNAAKFTPGPRVEVATSVGEGSGGRTLVFRISDRGRGIPPPERAAILDRISSRRRDYSAYR
ncbi:MAG TPA: PAS domain-containing sensor histidine kinase, partial [Candidatus Thermoplasmatota archaeon]